MNDMAAGQCSSGKAFHSFMLMFSVSNKVNPLKAMANPDGIHKLASPRDAQSDLDLRPSKLVILEYDKK